MKTKSNTFSPKRILSLDGGGVRGCLSLGYLGEIEKIVRIQLNNKNATLSDYFDLIGGTSTGALIAAQLAMGFDVTTIRKNYQELGPKVFSKKTLINRLLPLTGKKLFTKWSVQPLEREIKKIISEKTTLVHCPY